MIANKTHNQHSKLEPEYETNSEKKKALTVFFKVSFKNTFVLKLTYSTDDFVI